MSPLPKKLREASERRRERWKFALVECDDADAAADRIEQLERALEALVRYTEACEGMLNVTPAGQVTTARQLLMSVPDCDCGYTDSKCAIDCPTQKGWPDDPLKEAGIKP